MTKMATATVSRQQSSGNAAPDDRSSWERRALVFRVADDAVSLFGDRADRAELERLARDAVDEIWDESVTIAAYIPVLALRRVREMLGEARNTPSERGDAHGVTPATR